MPFDAASPAKLSLADKLASLGIAATVPLPMLATHKARQLRRHRANQFATPYPYLLVAGLIAAMNMSFALPVTFSLMNMIVVVASVLAGASGAVVLLMLVLTWCEFMGIRSIRGKAQWVEKRLEHYQFGELPRPIRNALYPVLWHPRMTLIYGELIQNRKVLDPYVIIQMDDEQACLGIWDDQRVIACAAVNT